ncbi:MAG: hypothetical protein HRT82_16075 [Henriciella sp.]|nr:hypothetical protein [Henriciella sp.]
MISDKESKTAGQPPQWLKSLAERFPTLFDTFLFLFAMTVTIILLAQKQYSFVLYQGF